MSKRKNRERGARGEIYREGRLIHVTPGEKVDAKEYGTLLLTCGKCHRTFSETMASEHLKKCQPLGAMCGKCWKKFSPEEFMPHFKGCKGLGIKVLEKLHAD
jgi:bacterioferritin-associated ferredoxin